MSKPKIRQFKAQNARELAARALWRVYAEQAYSNLALNAVLSDSGLGRTEHKLASAMFYGTLTETPALDELIALLYNRPPEKLDTAVRLVLRLGLWQLYYSGQADHAAVNESVKLIKKLGYASASGLVNALLRRALREYPAYRPQTDEGISGFGSGVCRLFYQRLGSRERVYRLGEAFREHHGTFMRFRTPPAEDDALRAELASEGECREGFFQPRGLYFKSGGQAPDALPAWQRRAIIAQGESAMLPAQILAPEKDDLIYDFCAAPGGKTMQLAEAAREGRVAAGELHPERVELMRKRFVFYALNNIQTLQHDAARPWPLARKADKILADVPCSGLGLIASKPELAWRGDEKNLAELLPLQAAVLDQAAEALREGGLLLYSTCTLNEAENEEQIRRFLERHEGFSLADMRGRAPAQEARLKALDENTAAEMAGGMMTLWPDRVHGEGFFLALLRKGRG